VTSAGVLRGKTGIRDAFTKLPSDKPQAKRNLKKQVYKNDILLLEWSVDSAETKIGDGVDTFVFKDGFIRAQRSFTSARPASSKDSRSFREATSRTAEAEEGAKGVVAPHWYTRHITKCGIDRMGSRDPSVSSRWSAAAGRRSCRRQLFKGWASEHFETVCWFQEAHGRQLGRR
jgi:hypothetical protein